MTLLDVFRSIEQTRLSTAIRNSRWDFAVIEMVHLVALALLGGAVLVLGLRALSVILVRQPLGRVARSVAPLLLAALLTLLCSGALLVADDPLRYYGNIAFRAKMLLLAIAVACGAPPYRAARHAAGPGASPRWLRRAAAVSLALWLADPARGPSRRGIEGILVRGEQRRSRPSRPGSGSNPAGRYARVSGALPARQSAAARILRDPAEGMTADGRPRSMQSWAQWQTEVVTILRHDLEEVLHHVALDDVDWPSWRSFYLQGKSPRAAVDRALERDL